MTWLLIVGCLAIIGLTGVPVGIGLALTGLLILYLNGGEFLAVPAVWNVFTAFIFSAVPAFIFMGEILLRSGVTGRLYDAANPFFTRVPGKLLHTNIAVCTLFSSVSGSSTATAAAVGAVGYPALRERGYDRETVVGSLAAGGTLGLLIPPSILMILYGAMQSVSIGKLFLAGLLPGLMLAALFMLVIAIKAWRNPGIAGAGDQLKLSLGEKFGRISRAWPVVLVSGVVLGSIYGGYATPTEAASIGIVIAIGVGIGLRELTLRDIWDAFVAGTYTFGAIALIMLGALILAQAISVLGLPHELSRMIQTYDLSPVAALVAVIGIYLVLGAFFEGTSLMLMTVPFVYPVMTGLGFDPIWLGVIIIICIEIGMLTPPVGINLFVLTAVAKGEVPFSRAIQAALPFWGMMLLAIAILFVFPAIALFLPDYLLR